MYSVVTNQEDFYGSAGYTPVLWWVRCAPATDMILVIHGFECSQATILYDTLLTVKIRRIITGLSSTPAKPLEVGDSAIGGIVGNSEVVIDSALSTVQEVLIWNPLEPLIWFPRPEERIVVRPTLSTWVAAVDGVPLNPGMKVSCTLYIEEIGG
jgi:hypothetical protein